MVWGVKASSALSTLSLAIICGEFDGLGGGVFDGKSWLWLRLLTGLVLSRGRGF